MARIRFGGNVLTAEPIMQYLNGDWLMRAKGKGARFDPGHTVRVKPDEIIEMAAAEMPSTAAVAMTQDEKDSAPMSSKLSRLAELAKDTHASIDTEADKSIDRLVSAKARAMDGMSKINTLAASYDKGADDLEAFAKQVSNFPPLDGK